jgi:acetoin utilization deacetylase AcuC-like enzyme
MTVIVTSPKSVEHQTGPGHPECPERCVVIEQALRKSGVLTQKNHLSARKATHAELLACHTPLYLDLLEREIAALQGELRFLSTGDVVISPASYEAALYAAGAALVAVDAVMQGKTKNAFCLVRPPGHHACSNRGMGFCLLNNVAIAARYVQREYQVERVLIVDWDVHHGNGTQEIFDEDPSVFYFSTHQEGIYPGTGFTDDRGNAAAVGTKCNCLVPSGKNSKNVIRQAFMEQLVPAMELFRPQFVFISAGFDAHHRDPLGGLTLSEQDFVDLTKIVMQIANVHAKDRLVSVLEGGYDLAAIAACSVQHVSTLNS